MSAGTTRYAHRFRLLPAELGLNDVTLLAGTEQVSTTFSGESYNQITIEVSHTFVAATEILVFLDTSEDGARWARQVSVATSVGVGTATAFRWDIQTGSASNNYTLNTPLNSPRFCRVRLDSTGGTTDTASVIVHLGTQ